MAHWAELDDNNIVLRVIVTDNNMPNEGYDWIMANLGGKWIQTSYNTMGNVHLLGGNPMRKNYAAIGFTYDEKLDAFIPPKPKDGWVWELDEETGTWVHIDRETVEPLI